MSRSIAIVGMGGVFPGSPDMDAFWDMVRSGEDAVRTATADDWRVEPSKLYDPQVASKDRLYSLKAAFVSPEHVTLQTKDLHVDQAWLDKLDPLFHTGLCAAQRAMAGSQLATVDRRRIGVMIGHIVLPTESTSAFTRQWLGQVFAHRIDSNSGVESASIDSSNHYAAGLPADLIAQAFGFGGPTFTLDAACASSLYAIKLAADALETGRADAVIAGGLSRPDSLYTQMGFGQLRALAASGEPSPFDHRGDGLVVGEGAGMFVLKRLEDAQRDGDPILGVLRGAGLANDRDGSLLAPSSEGQLRAMRAAYAEAGWLPHQVDLIECHATGTPLGDRIEFESLCTLWQEAPAEREAVIGSVKSNVGHLLTAAGSAALAKVLLAMQHEMLPPTAHFERYPDSFPKGRQPFRVLQQAEPWSVPADDPRRAAVSAFGFGGIDAHLLIEAPSEKSDASDGSKDSKVSDNPPEPIAIVGIGAHTAGAGHLQQLQHLLLGLTAPPAPNEPRWWGLEKDASFKSAGYDKLTGFFLDRVDVPVGRFRIPPKEILEMLPQQVLMLLAAADAVDDAQIDVDWLRAGILVGIGLDPNTGNFQLRWDLASRAAVWAKRLGYPYEGPAFDAWVDELADVLGPALNANRTTGALGGMVASRLAREFRCGGPSFTLSCEERSGLQAVDTAVGLLRRGELNVAVAGAVDLAADFRLAMAAMDRGLHQQTGAGRLGDGAVAFVLKRLTDAEADGDRVYAVIEGTASGCETDGESAVQRTLAAALAENQTPVEAVGLVAASRGACPAIDEDSKHALHQTLLKSGSTRRKPVLTSAVPEIGYCGAAAGAMDMLKAVLALYHKVLPALQTDVEPVDDDWFRDGAQPMRTMPWLRERQFGSRRAAVNAKAFGGSVHQLILREYDPEAMPETTLPSDPVALFFVEGADANALAEALDELVAEVGECNEAALVQLASRRSFKPDTKQALALALLANSGADLCRRASMAATALREHGLAADQERAFAVAKRRGHLFFDPQPVGQRGGIAFVYPGSGSHFNDMGRLLALRWPKPFHRQDAFTDHFANQIRADKFWSGAYPADIDQDHRTLLTTQVALGVSLTDLLRTFGIKPTGMIGYSLGETASLLSAGAWRDRDSLHRRTMESDLFTERLGGKCQAARDVWQLSADEPVDWALGVVNRGAKEVKAALAGYDRAYLLIVNTPSECVVGGQRAQVEALVESLDAQYFSLGGVVTVHCPVAEPDAQAYRDLHLFETQPPDGVRFYSCAWGKAYVPTRERAADSILAQALKGVDYPKTITAAYDDGFRVFVEVGPGASCTRMIGRILGDKPHVAVALTPPSKNPYQHVLRMLGQLITHRVAVDLSPLYDRTARPAQTNDRPLISVPVGGESFQMPTPPQPVAKPTPSSSTHAEHPVGGGASREEGLASRTKEKPAMAKSTTLSQDQSNAGTPPQPTGATSHTEFDAKAAEMAGKFDALIQATEQAAAANRASHSLFLKIATENQQAQADLLAYRMSLLTQLGSDVNSSGVVNLPSGQPQEAPVDVARRYPSPLRHHDNLFMDRSQCMEYAVGSIAAVLGDAYAPIDDYPTRVRLPDEPLMLVDRVLRVSGETMTAGNVVTEHDIHPGAWYLDGGRIPTCIAVEAGQADLFLSGYLGIDFETKGLAVYRLLDAVVTFHRELPGPGEVIHYDIYIERFWKQGDSWFFRFRFDGTVNGEPLLTMREGCAGFFTEAALAAGKGVVKPKMQQHISGKQRPSDWVDWVTMQRVAYDEAQIDALRQGDLATCFGQAFANLNLERPVGLPDGPMRLVHRVTDLVPQGGAFGLGFIRAEADIHPDDWFITCHFVDDRVMPGTLMYECCLHTLRIYLYRLGWIGEEAEVICQPVPEVRGRLKCRGQVLEHTQVVTYEVTIKELGYMPEPYAIVDALMYADGKPIVEITDMSLRMTGLNKQRLHQIWQGQPGVVAESQSVPRYDYERILAFSVGKPSEAFGERYQIYDHDRVIARLPGPPFLFMSRVVEIDAEQWEMKAGGHIVSEYDVPQDAWYFDADRQQVMPFAVLLEAALQPCGWFAGYMGSALRGGDVDLSFRNLGGSAIYHRPVKPDVGTLQVRVDVTRVSQSGGMIIQDYTFEVSDCDGLVYVGTTYFGFFSKLALANQVGIRDAKHKAVTASPSLESFDYPELAPFPAEKLRMLDRIDAFLPQGGPHGLGYISGKKKVKPGDWFFAAHFYQDPVVPGSLGLESFIQLLKVVAQRRWQLDESAGFVAVAPGEEHRWEYRGQVLPSDDEVTVYAEIKAFDDASKVVKADGFLLVDGRTIYQMQDFTLQVY